MTKTVLDMDGNNYVLTLQLIHTWTKTQTPPRYPSHLASKLERKGMDKENPFCI